MHVSRRVICLSVFFHNEKHIRLECVNENDERGVRIEKKHWNFFFNVVNVNWNFVFVSKDFFRKNKNYSNEQEQKHVCTENKTKKNIYEKNLSFGQILSEKKTNKNVVFFKECSLTFLKKCFFPFISKIFLFYPLFRIENKS